MSSPRTAEPGGQGSRSALPGGRCEVGSIGLTQTGPSASVSVIHPGGPASAGAMPPAGDRNGDGGLKRGRARERKKAAVGVRRGYWIFQTARQIAAVPPDRTWGHTGPDRPGRSAAAGDPQPSPHTRPRPTAVGGGPRVEGVGPAAGPISGDGTAGDRAGRGPAARRDRAGRGAGSSSAAAMTTSRVKVRRRSLGAAPVETSVRIVERRSFDASYESSEAEAFGNLRSSPEYLSPAFLKAEPSSMYFRC